MAFMSPAAVAKSAFYKFARDTFGDGSKDSVDKMRKTFAQGLDASALRSFTERVDKLAADNTNGRRLMELTAIQDYGPMISRTFGMRYACRQAGCGFIPRSETDWIIFQHRWGKA